MRYQSTEQKDQVLRCAVAKEITNIRAAYDRNAGSPRNDENSGKSNDVKDGVLRSFSGDASHEPV